MVKFTGRNKLNTAVFISGAGSNLKNLIKFSLLKKSPIKIELVISDKKKVRGLIISKKYNIDSKVYEYKNKENTEKKILENLNKKKINLICLAGFMKILSSNFVKKFNGKILNIHPSLLPKYKGLNTHERAIKNNEKFSGCTVHIVNSKLDSGKIILQKKVKIRKVDTPESLSKRILIQEHKLYPRAILKIFSS